MLAESAAGILRGANIPAVRVDGSIIVPMVSTGLALQEMGAVAQTVLSAQVDLPGISPRPTAAVPRVGSKRDISAVYEEENGAGVPVAPAEEDGAEAMQGVETTTPVTPASNAPGIGRSGPAAIDNSAVARTIMESSLVVTVSARTGKYGLVDGSRLISDGTCRLAMVGRL